MIDYEYIASTLKAEYEAGMTYNEIAQKHGISYTYIHNLLSGKRPIAGLTLAKLNALFPDASLSLHGDTVSIRADHNSGNVVGINRGKIFADYMNVVMDKILESKELSDAEKIKVMKVLKR